jgi:hypothetical protein
LAAAAFASFFFRGFCPLILVMTASSAASMLSWLGPGISGCIWVRLLLLLSVLLLLLLPLSPLLLGLLLASWEGVGVLPLGVDIRLTGGFAPAFLGGCGVRCFLCSCSKRASTLSNGSSTLVGPACCCATPAG